MRKQLNDRFLIKKPETIVQEQVSNCVSIVEIHNETTTDVSSLDIQTFNDLKHGDLEQNKHTDTNKNNSISQNIPSDFSSTKKVYTDKVASYLNESVFRRKLQNGASQHENTSQHRPLETVLKQRLLEDSAANVDKLLTSETLKVKNYWIQVLKMCALHENLPKIALRGKTQIIGNIHNGNFLMVVELVAEFDPFLAAYIEKYENPGKGGTSYLSSIVLEEIVILKTEKVKQQIFKELKEDKYYSTSVDPTPDILHQLAFIIRYVKKWRRKKRNIF